MLIQLIPSYIEQSITCQTSWGLKRTRACTGEKLINQRQLPIVRHLNQYHNPGGERGKSLSLILGSLIFSVQIREALVTVSTIPMEVGVKLRLYSLELNNNHNVSGIVLFLSFKMTWLTHCTIRMFKLVANKSRDTRTWLWISQFLPSFSK